MDQEHWPGDIDGGWIKAQAHRDRREYLDAVDAGRRALRLRLSSPLLLRKPDKNRRQAQLMRQLAAELTNEVRAQMRHKRRRHFRSPVAVTIDLHAVALDQPPGTPPSVKAYLDLLQGLAYEDDRNVLVVHATRHAADNPILRNTERGWVWDAELPRFPVGPAQGVEVRIDVRPVRLYTAGYDALWRRRQAVFGDHAVVNRNADGKEVFESERMDDFLANDTLEDLEAEQREDLTGTGPLYGPGGVYDRDEASRELRGRIRVMREQRMASMRNRPLLRQWLGPTDRPGPLSSSAVHFHPYEWMQAHGYVLPGVLELPLPSDTTHPSDYGRTVAELVAAHARRVQPLAPFAAPLALDIAVRQPPSGRKDLDNLAHTLMGPYERVFCAGARGSIASYRVYVTESGPPGVRVLVMPDARLEALPRAMETTRQWILAQRPHLRD